MYVISCLCLFVIVCGTLGHSWEKTPHHDDIKELLNGSMRDSVFVNDYVHKRQKREEPQFETVEEVVKFLLNEVENLRSRVNLLEKDNANFQQYIATIVKVTDDRMSRYSCGCLKEMLLADGVVPCALTTVINANPPAAAPTKAAIPTEASTESPESVEYLDVPMDKPLDPSIIAVSYYGHHFYRYLMENTTADIMASERRMTYAVAFDPTEEKLLWSSYTPSAIYSAKIDGTNFTTLARDILSYGLAVDPDKNVVFLTTVSPRHAVAVMSTDGTGYRVIAHTSRYGRPSRVSLDLKNEVAFVAFRSRILKVSYNGSEQSVLLTGRYITCLTYDNHNAVLYFGDRIVINKVTDTTETKPKTKRVIRFQPKTGSYPSDLYVHGDNMYIGYKFKNTLEVMSLTTKEVSTLATLDGEFVSVCRIYPKD